ncbi:MULTISPECIES: hypothetical protein [Arthrobacter]|uniref:hypothetical protein n=1 Tax=Arthrobacter TaxID=1663 RepID=UPI001404A659|nr:MULTISPECIES: hypothetical protein [Arthrobacter]MBT8161911.1 hypothetical protein [Arthrobacter sp. GN70]
MSDALDAVDALDDGQLRIVRELVGDAIAREDGPALQSSYQDFRAGMESLRSAFAELSA